MNDINLDICKQCPHYIEMAQNVPSKKLMEQKVSLVVNQKDANNYNRNQ